METSCVEPGNNAILTLPNRKKNFGFAFPKRYPLPIVRESDSESTTWNCIIGHLKEYCVEVTNENDIELLFTQGFFGKGTFSRSTPQALERKLKGSRKRGSKEKRKDNEQNLDFVQLSGGCEDRASDSENPAKKRRKDDVEVVLSDTNESTEDDSDSSLDVTPVAESTSGEKEALQLSLEEAYFLSYGLGVLVVKDKDQPLDLMRLWHKFCEIHPNKNFPIMYTAYHHFRSKGWIVRCGLKYGADFVLYKDGPPFYHSSYAVIVKAVKEQNLRDITTGGRLNLTWSSLAAVHRVCSHAAKDIMMLYVIKPATISENKISTPFCISQYQLEEVLVRRWVPSEDQKTS